MAPFSFYNDGHSLCFEISEKQNICIAVCSLETESWYANLATRQELPYGMYFFPVSFIFVCFESFFRFVSTCNAFQS